MNWFPLSFPDTCSSQELNPTSGTMYPFSLLWPQAWTASFTGPSDPWTSGPETPMSNPTHSKQDHIAPSCSLAQLLTGATTQPL